MSHLGTLSQTTLLSATTGSLPGYLFPVWQKTLLLPSAVVLDFVPANHLVPPKSKKEGYLGTVEWQNKMIPVFSFEVLNHGPKAPDPQTIAIVHAISIDDKIPEYGIALQATAEQVKVKISELEDIEKAPVGPMEFLQVRFREDLAYIPDMDKFEAKILSVI
ncbi:MAG: hypothetical protein Q7T36_07815 [Fluviicoccus sp.]|uniref:chemotaxis protein CheW n=1 Tax=Fluviicoccus sp. TaxID=2003552 RepID=UPI0027262E1C|nr:chemotaxis protein CheW [Fluviicoccus sp.]MDO8330359.1 hypothetical protein [Fluviicoccus sp.]